MNGRFFSAIVLSVVAMSGCQSAPVGVFDIKQIAPAHIRVRRPVYRPANPVAIPGGSDYRSDPGFPEPGLDCQPMESLLAGVSMKEFQACVSEIQATGKKQKIFYRLKREAQPFLELLNPKKAPTCLREKFARLSVPREIYYQALPTEERIKGQAGPYYECYAAGLDLSVDEFMGEKTSRHRWDLQLRFPLKLPPVNEIEATRLYLGWVLAPFFDQKKGQWVVPSKIAPRTLCTECFGEDQIVRPGTPLPLLWPAPQQKNEKKPSAKKEPPKPPSPYSKEAEEELFSEPVDGSSE